MEEIPGLYARTIPIDARVLNRARHEVINDLCDASIATQTLKQGQLLHSFLTVLARARRFLFDLLLLACAFTAALQLLGPGHALAGALIGFATARREELIRLLRLAARAATGDHRSNHQQSCTSNNVLYFHN